MKMFLDTLNNGDHKCELYKKLGETHARKRNKPSIISGAQGSHNKEQNEFNMQGWSTQMH